MENYIKLICDGCGFNFKVPNSNYYSLKCPLCTCSTGAINREVPDEKRKEINQEAETVACSEQSKS
jgi:hypothetical protein